MAVPLLSARARASSVGAFSLRQVGLHSQSGQRRFELMRCVRQKAFLRSDGIFQSHQQIVNGRHQRHDLNRHGLRIQWAEVIGAARPDAFFQVIQGFDGLNQCQPDQ